jgi:methylglyoxal synthase
VPGLSLTRSIFSAFSGIRSNPCPHDPDVKAFLRMAVEWNIPIACNRDSPDFVISSPLMDGKYDRLIPDYEGYRNPEI